MDNLCQVCRINWGKEIKIPAHKFSTFTKKEGYITFYVCEQCIEEKICPQCHGGGEIFIKRGSAPGSKEKCDLCEGSGEFDYTTLK